MWDQEKIVMMFPNNRIPSNPSIYASSLIGSDYEAVGHREQKMARGMVAQETEYMWYNDGRFETNIIYNVYPFPYVDNVPCLNVYGGKMVQNWLQFQEQEKKENKDNAGFNYTGL